MGTAYVNVSFKEAKEIMESGREYILLDVRTDEEFFTGHAESEVNLDVDEINAESTEEIIPTKQTAVLVYCKTGERARLAAEELSRLGYTNIYDIGSLVEWPYGISYD